MTPRAGYDYNRGSLNGCIPRPALFGLSCFTRSSGVARRNSRFEFDRISMLTRRASARQPNDWIDYAYHQSTGAQASCTGARQKQEPRARELSAASRRLHSRLYDDPEEAQLGFA